MNKHSILSKVHQLHDHFIAGRIPTLAQHEVHPELPSNDRLNYVYFTLPVSINFQRSSPAMWQAALATYNDPETNYVFYPEEVVQRPFETLQADLVKHRLALQPNRHTQIWQALSNTLHAHFNDDPREVIIAGESDVEKILELIRVARKKDFPYLSGAKMANYWLYILNHYTDVALLNKQAISIIPDTHVIQSSKVLGLTDSETDGEKIAQLWQELLDESELQPIDLHPVLWNWSRNNFKPEV